MSTLNALIWMLIGSGALVLIAGLLGAVLGLVVVVIKMRGGKRL